MNGAQTRTVGAGRGRKHVRRAERQAWTEGRAANVDGGPQARASGEGRRVVAETAGLLADDESGEGGIRTMAGKEIVDKLSIYIPQKRLEEKPVERLMKLGKRRDRSVNYLVVEAILQYVAREENEN